MLVILIIPNASLRSLLLYLFIQAHQDVSDFSTPQEALPLLQTTSVVITVLSVYPEAEIVRLLGPSILPITPHYLQLSPSLIEQVMRVQRRFTTVLNQIQHTPTVVMTDITPTQWAEIGAFLPLESPIGRPLADQQQTLNGMLFIVRTGTPWRLMPKRYGSYVTCWRRWKHWQQDGTWQHILDVLAH
jgi:hypothetical protein